MANIKTHLRELSPLLAFSGMGIDPKKITTDKFRKIIGIILKDSTIPRNIKLLSDFNNEQRLIIERGLSLGHYLLKKFGFSNKSKVKWVGNNTQSHMPIDLVIDGNLFSLKEDSFILENMGLYKLISLITGEETKRGQFHIFLDFAPQEFDRWFQYTWGYLTKAAKDWTLKKNKYISRIKVEKNNVKFLFNDKSCTLPIKDDFTVREYLNITNSTFREKVFAKWISKEIRYDSEYERLKRICAKHAGKNLVSYLLKNLDDDNDNLLRLLQIYDKPYYYAKVTNSKPKVFRVPDKESYSKAITIDSIKSSIPKSQLNLITKIKNLETDKELIIRNEIRYSHGQFNGTPEAKMYYDNSADLSTIYFRV